VPSQSEPTPSPVLPPEVAPPGPPTPKAPGPAHLPVPPPTGFKGWGVYYDDLFSKYPEVTDSSYGGRVKLNCMGHTDHEPPSEITHTWIRRVHAENWEANREARHLLGELRSLAVAAEWARGPARAAAMRRLDNRLSEVGLRPKFQGGAVFLKSRWGKIRRTYDHLREIIGSIREATRDADLQAVIAQIRSLRTDTHDEFLNDSRGRVDAGSLDTETVGLVCRFPFFDRPEYEMILAARSSRKGATAEIAQTILSGRLHIPPDTLHFYLFPRSR
jgi:hypothetical protein